MGSVQWLRDSPIDVMRDFYVKCKNMSASAIEGVCQRHVTATFEQKAGWVDNGLFKPLSVWVKEGWDGETIVAKAKPEDIRVDPDYHWDTYRVRIHSTFGGETRTNSDNIRLLAKARTRALRRKRTDESSVHSEPPKNDNDDFSDESSGDSDEAPLARNNKRASDNRGRNAPDDRGRKAPENRGPTAKAKGKAKAKKAPENKKAKAEAKSAGKKIEQGIQSARGVVGHRLIMEVDDDLVNPVKTHLRLLLDIQKATAQAAATGIDTYSEKLNAVEWREAKKSETALKRKLEKLSRRSD